MKSDDITTLREEFSSQILQETASNNETYLTVKKEANLKICDYIYHHLELPLISIFATDDRKNSGCFRIHYVFSGNEDTFIIIRINIDEQYPEFISATPKIPAANWYEREIQDMFGLVAKGHPDQRRLMNFEDWPDGVHPLRKDFDINTKPPRVNNTFATSIMN